MAYRFKFFPTQPIRERLLDFRRLVPGNPAVVYKFTDQLAEELVEPEISVGWYIGVFLTIPHVTRVRAERDLLQKHVPIILKTVASSEFLDEMEKFAKIRNIVRNKVSSEDRIN